MAARRLCMERDIGGGASCQRVVEKIVDDFRKKSFEFGCHREQRNPQDVTVCQFPGNPSTTKTTTPRVPQDSSACPSPGQARHTWSRPCRIYPDNVSWVVPFSLGSGIPVQLSPPYPHSQGLEPSAEQRNQFAASPTTGLPRHDTPRSPETLASFCISSGVPFRVSTSAMPW